VTNAKASGKHEPDPEHGRHVFRDVPSEHVINFLRAYQFHEKSQECDSTLLTRYIERRRNEAGSLNTWNVAVVGNPVGSALGDFDFAPDVKVGRIVRARLGSDEQPESADQTAVADIKTLMSRRDAAVDLSGETGKLTEGAIKTKRLEELPDTGLIVLYPIDKVSKPAPGREQRTALNAATDVIGVGLVFPQPAVDSPIEWNYVSADLSKIDIEEENFDALEAEESA
jgi:hypothetical protein